MLKELIIKKDDVVYGETGAGANVTVDTIASLAEGSFAVFTADGQLVTRTGQVQTLGNIDPTKPLTIYMMENSQLRSIQVLGKGRASAFTAAGAAKVLTFDVDNMPASIAEVLPTGLLIQDSDKNPHDPKARSRAELPVDATTTIVGAGNYEGDLATLIAAVDGVATAVGNGAGVITITLDAGRNLQFLATGHLEGVALTVTTALAYDSQLTSAELAVMEREVQAHLGRTQDDLVASQSDMFTKTSLVESGLEYYVYFVRFIHNPAELLDGANEAIHTLAVASPDAVPGGSDADGTWAALIGAIADQTTITDIP